MFKKLFSCFKPNKPTYEWQDMNVQISSFADYVKLALRTESKVCPWTGESFTQAQRVDHAVRGLVTEAGELVDAYKRHLYYGEELDIVNIKEEIGDCFWYIALASDAMNTPLKFTSVGLKKSHPKTILERIDTIFSNSHDLFDVVVFSEEPNRFFGLHLQRLYDELTQLVYKMGLFPTNILLTNLAKLAARYPDKFDEEAAIHRNLKTERNILEG